MPIELKVPPVGESITEVQIGDWLKAEGESVSRDEILVKIETDKVTVDLPAPASGVITQIKAKKGTVCQVGEVIGYMEEGAAAAAKPQAAAAAAPAPAAPAPAAPAPEAPKASRETMPPQGFARVMPSARRALKERGVQADDVEATGPGGRVLKEDVMRHTPAQAKPAVVADKHEEAVPMSPFRKKIAERLVQSQQTAALLTTFNEIDMTAAMALRKEYQESFLEKYGIKLGFMSFFVKAAIDALKLIPAVNGEIRGTDIIYKNYYDIGVAVGGGKGLAVPVIRSADRLSFAEVELAIASYGKRAKDNKLELSELMGGTFTISNGGIYGSLLSTPIVNPPQSGILGLHAIQDRPIALNGQVVIRPMMYIALTYDHRLVDGREAVTFLKRIKQCVEAPSRMLLEVETAPQPGFEDSTLVNQHDLVVIGAGPGGYVAAIRAAQLGLNVACIDAEAALGGTCLRVGCIPSKALLEASERYHEAGHALGEFGVKVSGVELDLARMLKRKEGIVSGLTQGVAGLFKKNKVTRYHGHGKVVGPGRVAVSGPDACELEAKHVIIATGSKVAPLRGVELDGDRIGTSTEALSYPEVPKHLVVIGAGYIGLELGSVWRRLGAKVTVLEYLERILPGMDAEIAREAERIFEKQGIEFKLGARVMSATRSGDEVTVGIDGQDSVRCDRVLLAVGRVPNTDDLGLASVGIELDPRGRVPIDDSFRTYVPGFYAIGDVVRGPMLAHKAEEEGVACVEAIVTGVGHVNYDAIPGVVYTHPEIASVGKTEEELNAQNVPFKKGSFPFMANGRARALGATEGRVKILAHAKTDRILGVHVIGPRAGDLIAEAAVAIEFSASAEDIARSSHAHPTLAEAMKEAALAVDRRAIHI